jgi:hypothetical protein
MVRIACGEPWYPQHLPGDAASPEQVVYLDTCCTHCLSSQDLAPSAHTHLSHLFAARFLPSFTILVGEVLLMGAGEGFIEKRNVMVTVLTAMIIGH